MPTTVATGKNVEWQFLTADEFLDWLQPGVFADLIDGEKFMHSSVHLKHARLVDFMRTLLKLYVERRGLGEILSKVWAVRLDARTVFMPDICYFTTGLVAALTPTHARFAPRMVGEVLSDHPIVSMRGRRIAGRVRARRGADCEPADPRLLGGARVAQSRSAAARVRVSGAVAQRSELRRHATEVAGPTVMPRSQA